MKNVNEHNCVQHIISRRHQTALTAMQTATGLRIIEAQQSRDEWDLSAPDLPDHDYDKDQEQDQDEEMDEGDPVSLKIKLEQEYGKWNLG